MSQKKALQIRGLTRDLISYVRLYGTIDETFDPGELLREAAGRDVILNLKAVTRISSFGVREWVHTLDALSKRSERISLVECSPAVVAQLNMVANFAAKTRVISVQVPYYCEACAWDAGITRELDRNLRTDSASLPAVECKRCKAAMTIDDDPATYFAFQASGAIQAPDPTLVAFMKDFAAAVDRVEDAPTQPQPPPPPISSEPTVPMAQEPEVSAKPSVVQRIQALPLAIRAGAIGVLLGCAVLLVLALTRGPAPTPDAKPVTVAAAPTAAPEPAPVAAPTPTPLTSEALLARAEDHRARAQIAEALSAYTEFLERFSREPQADDALFWKAELLVQKGDKREALAQFKRLVADFPKSNFKK